MPSVCAAVSRGDDLNGATTALGLEIEGLRRELPCCEAVASDPPGSCRPPASHPRSLDRETSSQEPMAQVRPDGPDGKWPRGDVYRRAAGGPCLARAPARLRRPPTTTRLCRQPNGRLNPDQNYCGVGRDDVPTRHRRTGGRSRSRCPGDDLCGLPGSDVTDADGATNAPVAARSGQS